MDRREDLEEYLREYLEKRMKLKKEFLLIGETHMEPVFREKLASLVKAQVRKQSEKKQNKIRYFFLCRLISSGYTGSHQTLLGLSNSMLYLDENKSYIYWYPEQLYADIEADMKEAEVQLRKKFIRLEDYELLHMRRKLLYDDWGLLQESFQRLITKSIYLITDSPLILENELLVLCGNYMEELDAKWCITTEGGRINE